jgi:hypothetical protein
MIMGADLSKGGLRIERQRDDAENGHDDESGQSLEVV